MLDFHSLRHTGEPASKASIQASISKADAVEVMVAPESVEGMQAGRASPGYDGGVFSPVMDAPTHHFHRWVAQRLAERTG